MEGSVHVMLTKAQRIKIENSKLSEMIAGETKEPGNEKSDTVKPDFQKG